MTIPELDPVFPMESEPNHIEGEHLSEDHMVQIRDTWLETTIDNITPLVPSSTEFMEFEPHNSDKANSGEEEMPVVRLPVEHGMDKKKKIIITAAAAATLASFGIAVLMRGRFSPKARRD